MTLCNSLIFADFSRLEKELNINKPEDWYHVTSADVNSKSGFAIIQTVPLLTLHLIDWYRSVVWIIGESSNDVLSSHILVFYYTTLLLIHRSVFSSSVIKGNRGSFQKRRQAFGIKKKIEEFFCNGVVSLPLLLFFFLTFS
jgi:hypothetical protein